MIELIAVIALFALCLAAFIVNTGKVEQHPRTDPESSPWYLGGILLVLVLSAYALVTENDARHGAYTQAESASAR